MSTKTARITGAVAFVLWGLLHVAGGLAIWLTVGMDGGPAVLAMMGTAVLNALPASTDAVTDAVLRFHGFNLAWMGVLVTALSVRSFRRPDPAGFWASTVIVALADLGLVLFLLGPGIMAVGDGLPGPVLLVVAAGFGLLGLRGLAPSEVA